MKNLGASVKYSDILLTWGGNCDKFHYYITRDDLHVFQTQTLDRFPNEKGETMFETNDIEVIYVCASPAAEDNTLSLKLSVGNPKNPTACLNEQTVVIWERDDMDDSKEESF